MANLENNDSENASVYEDEINLMDYFQIIVKRRKLIIGTFLIAVIVTAILSLLLPKVYQASASVMIMPSKIQSALSPSKIFLNSKKTKTGAYVAQRPAISILTHKILLKSNAVLERVINRLKLEGKWDKNLTLEGLYRKLDVEDTEETNILQLAVKDKDPGTAEDIANIWADEYVKYSLEIITGELKGSGKFIEDQFKLVGGSLIKAEQAVKDFDVKEQLLLTEIELKENSSQLKAHYAKVHELDFKLQEKKRQLMKVDADIAAMTKDGTWLGAFNVQKLGQEYFVDETLSDEQNVLRQKVLMARQNLENNRKKVENFINDSKIMLLRAEVERKKTNLVNDKVRLAQIRQLGESTKANLNSRVNLDMLRNRQGPIAENLSESTVWELLSLTSGYNFFETRGQSLSSKLKQQEKEWVALENSVFADNNRLKTLNENLNMAQANYDFFYGRLKTAQSQKNSLETEIAKIEFTLSYSKEMVKRLEAKVKTLKVAINAKRTKLTELNRQLDIAKKGYATLASKIEGARIAKAMELGEVKAVSMAFKPDEPVGPKKKRMVALAGIASLVLGIFMAFCLEFWQKGKESQKNLVQTP